MRTNLSVKVMWPFFQSRYFSSLHSSGGLDCWTSLGGSVLGAIPGADLLAHLCPGRSLKQADPVQPSKATVGLAESFISGQAKPWSMCLTLGCCLSDSISCLSCHKFPPGWNSACGERTRGFYQDNRQGTCTPVLT